MRARPWLASALLLLSWSAPALAVGVGSTDGPLRVREDYVLVVVDGVREHVVYAARLEMDARPAGPADVHAVVAIPTSARPDVEPMRTLDLPAALFALSAAYEERALGRRPVPPAPWPLGGVRVEGAARDLAEPAAAKLPLDAAGICSITSGGSAPRDQPIGGARRWLAVLDVSAEGLRGEEISTPAARISFETDHPGLVLAEPPLAEKHPRDGEATTAASREPYVVEDVAIPAVAGAPSSEAVARVLRTRAASVRGCYDAYVADRPGAEVTTRVRVVVNRRGDTESATPAGATGDAAMTALSRCVVTAVRAKSFPRIDRDWSFTATLHFMPPAAPSRRTHLVLVGDKRLRWSAPPPGVTLVAELELDRSDLERAFDPTARSALGLGGGSRRWLTAYLDTAERRTDRADLVVESSPVPAEGEPGTRGFAVAPAAPPAPPETPPARAAVPHRRRRYGSILYPAVLLLVVGAAVALALSQDR